MTEDSNTSPRYAGHSNLCEIDLPGQARIRRGKVLVVGAGGLGSPVILYLAAAGVGLLRIVDPDTVDLSNLQRQIIHTSERQGMEKALSARSGALAVNSEAKIEPIVGRFNAETADELLKGIDFVADCTDNFMSRVNVSDACARKGVACSFGSVIRFGGMAMTQLPGTATYADLFGREEPAEPQVSCSREGVLNAAVGIIGSIQAAEALKYLAGCGQLLTNRLLKIDTLTMKFEEYEV